MTGKKRKPTKKNSVKYKVSIMRGCRFTSAGLATISSDDLRDFAAECAKMEMPKIKIGGREYYVLNLP